MSAPASAYGECEFVKLKKSEFTIRLISKLQFLNGFPLKISLNERFPTSLNESQIPENFLKLYFNRGMDRSGGFGGADGLVLGNIAMAMNFRADIIRPTIDLFGYKMDNGTFIGNY